MSAVLLRTTIATIMAFAGGAVGAALGVRSAHRFSLLIYGAMGVLLGVTVCDVLPDAKDLLPWLVFVPAVASGFVLFWLINKYVSHLCPSCAYGLIDADMTERLGRTVALLMLALGIHSTMDGIAIVVGDRLQRHADLGVLFGISFHKFPEGLALVLLLIGAGYARRQAFLWTLVIETTTELGGLIGLFGLRGVSLHWLGILFAHVGGGFLFLVGSGFGLFSAGSESNLGVRRIPSRPLVVSSSLGFALTAALIWTFSRITH